MVRVVSETLDRESEFDYGYDDNSWTNTPSSKTFTETPKQQRQPRSSPPHSLIRSLLLTSPVTPSLSISPSNNVPSSITHTPHTPPHGQLDHHHHLLLHPSLPRSKQSESGRLRPLIIPMFRSHNPLLRSSSPGSPPDLTDSKSSKSSSYPSSSLADSTPTDLSHFEDISLDDVSSLSPHNPWSQDKLGGSQLRNLPSSIPSRTSLLRQQRSLRDLTNNVSRNAPVTSSNINTSRSKKFQLPLPNSRPTRPRIKHLLGSSRPSSPSNHAHPSRTPSVSPPAPTTTIRNYSPAPRSAGPSSSSGHSRFSSASIHALRRQTARQPGRKTVAELEDEYHDSDEEVPDDAVIWNVPISPRPPHEREFTSTSESSDLSASSMGQQQDRSHGHSPMDRTDSGLSTAPAAVEIRRPLSPLSPGSEISEVDYQGHHHHMRRLSTRDAALEDLSKEAKELTTALELLAEQSELRTEAHIQSGKQKSHSSSPTRAVIKPADLPPVRKNDPLIDPLPVSKEKERFLTRTRPSWLPPKDQKEEKRHLKEYQAMMARAAEAEEKRIKKMQKIQCERDAIATERTKQWEDRVLPSWNETISTDSTKDLYWAGIPTSLRGVVWTRAAGNALNLTTTSYSAALSRAQETQARLATLTPEERLRDPMGALLETLDTLTSSMPPALSLFSPTGPLHQSLKDVCAAYYAYRPPPPSSPTTSDTTTLTLIPHLSALLLLNLPAPSAFTTLATLLHAPLATALLENDEPALQVAYNSLLLTLQDKLPSLHAHLLTLSAQVTEEPLSPRATSTNSSNHSSSPFISALFRPILEALVFATGNIGVDVSTRLLDVRVFEDDEVILRAAVEVLGVLEGRLYGESGCQVVQEVLREGCWLPDSASETEGFLAMVRGSRLGRAFGG